VKLDRLRELYRDVASHDAARELATGGRRRYECNFRFAMQRLDEGVEVGTYLDKEYPAQRLTILDVGAGNGGVSLGLAATRDHFIVAIDVVPNQTLAELKRASGLHVRQVVASADQLPFRPGSFDVVLCLETVEHLPDVPAAASEIMQTLRARGQVMLTTPPRFRFLFRGDPHFDIRGLLLLPDALQRLVVERLLRRGSYDVTHTFWFAPSIIRLFAGRSRTETLINIPWPPPPRRGRQWWELFRHHFFKRLRHVLWDRIVIYR
jgi:2-polyprenyl-3-methyl-5-hydroxy-6-metoxy-1,4-benzoquinol methylase